MIVSSSADKIAPALSEQIAILADHEYRSAARCNSLFHDWRSNQQDPLAIPPKSFGPDPTIARRLSEDIK